jgi:hypothetical protein
LPADTEPTTELPADLSVRADESVVKAFEALAHQMQPLILRFVRHHVRTARTIDLAEIARLREEITRLLHRELCCPECRCTFTIRSMDAKAVEDAKPKPRITPAVFTTLVPGTT